MLSCFLLSWVSNPSSSLLSIQLSKAQLQTINVLLKKKHQRNPFANEINSKLLPLYSKTLRIKLNFFPIILFYIYVSATWNYLIVLTSSNVFLFLDFAALFSLPGIPSPVWSPHFIPLGIWCPGAKPITFYSCQLWGTSSSSKL